MITTRRGYRVVVFIFIVGFYSNAVSAAASCTWPAVFQDSTWEDNEKGTLTFTADQMTGYSFVSISSTIATWECFSVDQWDSGGHLAMKAVETVDYLGTLLNVYLCWRMTKVTDYSYYYYHAAAQLGNGAEQRAYVPFPGQDETLAAICNDTAGASGSAFQFLVKTGFEEQAKSTCPSVFLGRFDYNFTSAPDGADHCTSSMHLNVCSDKTTFSFEETCSRSIAYAEASVHCMFSMEISGNTFLVTYNPQSTAVDNSNTYRFACFAMSSDSTKATVVYKNCTAAMTPEVLPLLHDGTPIGGSIVFSPYVFCQGGCNFPAVFASSTWLDNTRGDIVWTTTTVTGWSFTTFTYNVQNWECLKSDTFDTDGILLLKATDTFVYLSSTFISYLCLKFNKVSDYSYTYYQMNNVIPNAANERVTISTDGGLTTTAQICQQSSTAGFVGEFHFMVKSGQESAAKQYCNPALLAKMDYTYNPPLGASECGSTLDNWDVCTDRMVMSFDYTNCSQVMAYSAAGEVWCMANITSTYEYVVVYNTDSSPTYKFACFVVSTDGTQASVVYNNCTMDQTPTTKAMSHDGTVIGATITMTAKETCPFLGPSTDTPSSSSSTQGDGGTDLIPIIVGAVVGVIALAAIIGITVYCIKKKKQQNVAPEKPPVTEAPTRTASQPVLEDLTHPEPTPVNPAITAHPESNRLPPLPTVSPRGANALPPIQNGHALT